MICKLVIFFLFISCNNKKEDDYNYVIEKVENFKKINNRFPNELKEININEIGLCYYTDKTSFSLEFIVQNDLHWYNSGNGFWDFLEGDAFKFNCK